VPRACRSQCCVVCTSRLESFRTATPRPRTDWCAPMHNCPAIALFSDQKAQFAKAVERRRRRIAALETQVSMIVSCCTVEVSLTHEYGDMSLTMQGCARRN
jgi:hypothetical protein